MHLTSGEKKQLGLLLEDMVSCMKNQILYPTLTLAASEIGIFAKFDPSLAAPLMENSHFKTGSFLFFQLEHIAKTLLDIPSKPPNPQEDVDIWRKLLSF